jgi:tetratricopeptide (TPR) repeat protein
MTATKGSDNRVVLPRWRVWKGNQASGEFHPLRPAKSVHAQSIDSVGNVEFVQRVADFQRSKGVYEAADVVSAAIVLGLEESQSARDAARVLYDSALPIGREMAERVLLKELGSSARVSHELEARVTLDSEHASDEDRVQVARLRRIVRRQPRSALQWTDLALAHTVLGNVEAARKAIRVAIALSPDNRTILRAAARFYVCENDLNAARSVLSSDVDRLLSDPWLLAADIAIADLAGQPLKFGNRAKKLLEADLAPRHLSELAAALATAELEAGRAKQARKLFARALQDPTDNSVAQVEWATSRGAPTPPIEISPPLNFEADARHALRQGDFDSAAIQSRLWQEDQPFALDPARHASYISSTLSEDFRTAVLACEMGLRTNPGDQVLLNNLAFSLANLNLTDDASRVMAQLKIADDPRKVLVWTATWGLIAFRQGDVIDGRRLYQESIDGWRQRGNEEGNAARASIFWAREEVRLHTDYAGPALALMEKLCAGLLNNPEIRILCEKVRSIAGDD